ncbi:hypothetical protein GE061_004194, partial [Apolygus lucorum]
RKPTRSNKKYWLQRSVPYERGPVEDALLRPSDKESLRLQHPPAPSIARLLCEDVQLPNGHIIPAGAKVLIYIILTHRNPKYWDDPDAFSNLKDLIRICCKTRHPYSYIPFSAGPRNCIGQKFALLEMKIGVSTILRANDKVWNADHSAYQITQEVNCVNGSVQFTNFQRTGFPEMDGDASNIFLRFSVQVNELNIKYGYCDGVTTVTQPPTAAPATTIPTESPIPTTGAPDPTTAAPTAAPTGASTPAPAPPTPAPGKRVFAAIPPKPAPRAALSSPAQLEPHHSRRLLDNTKDLYPPISLGTSSWTSW